MLHVYDLLISCVCFLCLASSHRTSQGGEMRKINGVYKCGDSGFSSCCSVGTWQGNITRARLVCGICFPLKWVTIALWSQDPLVSTSQLWRRIVETMPGVFPSLLLPSSLPFVFPHLKTLDVATGLTRDSNRPVNNRFDQFIWYQEILGHWSFKCCSDDCMQQQKLAVTCVYYVSQYSRTTEIVMSLQTNRVFTMKKRKYV